ncbi:hypothetical protein C8N24_3012 [Solirubrobacter pauli]|uniref:Excalibur calcium-binding domain-containing protein n=1 Tax=Solirubrobacter pauli TaxID=166793 RepID=A0A660LDP4_9ACTN|nr:hypothetical protein [Solirubrobacter pauli]RKQ93152.1 hypothetical protein C8N24_3012 [Solirubrobacter pauli]
MKSLVLAFLLALVFAGTAEAQSVSGSDPADTPASPYDIEALRVTYDAAPGTLQVTWRLVQPLPASAPFGSGQQLSANVKQDASYYRPCSGWTSGDVTVNVANGTMLVGDVWPYRASYQISGRSGWIEAPVALSQDRREVTATVTDTAITGRTFFCADATSSAGTNVVADRRVDTVPFVYFPGFAPTPATLVHPVGGLFHGTTPQLSWDSSATATSELVKVYAGEPSSENYPKVSEYFSPTYTGSSDGSLQRIGGRAVYTLKDPLPDGVYTWVVERSFGSLPAQLAGSRFEIGPPDLARLVLTPRIRQPASATAAGSGRLTVDATRGAAVTLTVKRGTRTVRTSRFSLGTDQDDKVKPVTVSVALPCRTPGRYTATAIAADRYGKQLTATGSWTVSKTRCAKLKRAAARKRAAAKRRKTARRKAQTPRSSCMGGYSPCLPVTSDLDCDEIPESKKPVSVTGSDPYRLDADDDGVGCE